jgi:hypothetical protein
MLKLELNQNYEKSHIICFFQTPIKKKKKLK